MKIIKITAELIKDLLQTGKIIKKTIIKKGVSPADRLIAVDYKKGILELYFSEGEECKEEILEIETVEDKNVQ